MTFAFVDVVESTKTFTAYGELFVAALAVLQEQIARHARSAGGVVVKTEGDGAFLAFPSAESAVKALVGLQNELAMDPDDGRVPRLAVRAGAHTGDAVPAAGDYVALAVNVAARVTSAAGAGQVVVSAATQAELGSPVGVYVGEYDLKDVAHPMALWRVCGGEAPLRAPPARRTNARVPLTGFVGRTGQVEHLRDLLTAHRLVTVLGPGGLGKTRLATELLLQIAAKIPGGAWMVELASLATDDQVPGAIGDVLGLQTGDLDAITAEVRRRGAVLLLLDNCEHLLDAVADVVADLLEPCPELTVLCTSREPLQAPGEYAWRLPSLAGQAARIELFTERARASGGTVSDGAADEIARLCAALDGLPLAIELAATQSGSTSLEELIRVVEEGTDDLARRGGQARQRSLDAVLSWSLDCLPAPRRASLLVLSILPGRFDLDMATTVLAAVDSCEVDAVRPLARASLIDLDGESYRILDTIRHAARRHLANDRDLAQKARLGLRTWAVSAAAALHREQRPLDDVPLDQVLAWEIALEQAMEDDASGMGRVWHLLSMVAHYREPSERFVALAERLVAGPLPSDPDDDLCFAGAVNLFHLLRTTPVPKARLEAICASADSHGVGLGSGYLHFNLAYYYLFLEDPEGVRKHTRAFELFALTSPDADETDRLMVHETRGLLAVAAGTPEEVLEHAERRLAEGRNARADQSPDVAEANVAEALLDLNRPQEALPHALEALRLTTTAGARRRQWLLLLARAYSQLGDAEAAVATTHEFTADLIASGRSREQIQAALEDLRRAAPLASPADPD